MNLNWISTQIFVVGIVIASLNAGSCTTPAARCGDPHEQWGKARNGLQLRIWLNKPLIGPTDPISVCCAIRNISKSPRTALHAYFWSNHIFRLTGPDGLPVKLTNAGEVVRKDAARGTFEKTFLYTIPPAGVDTDWPVENLRDYFMIKDTGRYFVECEYRNGAVTLTSNRMVLWIKK